MALSAWLALREAADFAARSTTLTALVAGRLSHKGAIRILDLATGTGANIRYLAPRLPAPQEWLAVDKDSGLLAEAIERSRTLPSVVQLESRALDLDKVGQPEIFEKRHLVTASALLDLVSDAWLRRVARECRRVGACALFAITYDGRNECTPADPDDGVVFGLFNQHQRSDKGLGGPAAGPQATQLARAAFEAEGFDVRIESSDWQIPSTEREFQHQLISGWAAAATETAEQSAGSFSPRSIEAWKQRRVAHLVAGRSRIIVGHHDLAAINPDA